MKGGNQAHDNLRATAEGQSEMQKWKCQSGKILYRLGDAIMEVRPCQMEDIERASAKIPCNSLANGVQ